jgi:hypothetical protein
MNELFIALVTLVILAFIASLFFLFDNEILHGYFAKKIRKYVGVEE